jgi:glutaminyl-tRNA synthetase
MEVPAKGYFRLSPGSEVRLKHAYYVKCVSIEKDVDGNVSLIHCTYDPETRGGWSNDGRKVKGTIHWVSALHTLKCEVRIYDHLFTKENPDDMAEDEDYRTNLNPDSLEIVEDVFIEPFAQNFSKGDKFQFERTGYFVIDNDSTKEKIVFNRAVALKDSWGKIANKCK